MCLYNNVLAFLLIILYIHETSVSQGHVDKSQRHELVISSNHCCSIIFGHHQRPQGHMICPVYTLFCGSTLTMPTGVCLYHRTQRTKHIHSDAQIRGRLDMHACIYIFIHTIKHACIA